MMTIPEQQEVKMTGGSESWFGAPSTQDMWADNTRRGSEAGRDQLAWNSDSSSLYSLSPSDRYHAMFDSDLLLNAPDALDASVGFNTVSNTVSSVNSPVMKSINMDSGFDMIKNEFAQLPLSFDPLEKEETKPVTVTMTEPATMVKIEDDRTPSRQAVNRPTQKPQTKRRSSRQRSTQDQKEIHNMVEKRYRININTKIGKLQKIIPWVACEDTAFAVDNKIINPCEDEEAPVKSMKLNKSIILEKAVDYILYLQNNERLFELEVQRLRKEVAELKAAKASNTSL